MYRGFEKILAMREELAATELREPLVCFFFRAFRYLQSSTEHVLGIVGAHHRMWEAYDDLKLPMPYDDRQQDQAWLQLEQTMKTLEASVDGLDGMPDEADEALTRIAMLSPIPLLVDVLDYGS